MNNNLRLVVNNVNDKKVEDKHFFEKNELKISEHTKSNDIEKKLGIKI